MTEPATPDFAGNGAGNTPADIDNALRILGHDPDGGAA